MPPGQVAPEAEETISFGLKSSNGLYIDGGNNKHNFFVLYFWEKQSFSNKAVILHRIS